MIKKDEIKRLIKIEELERKISFGNELTTEELNIIWDYKLHGFNE